MSQFSQAHPDDPQGYCGAALRLAAYIVDGRETDEGESDGDKP